MEDTTKLYKFEINTMKPFNEWNELRDKLELLGEEFVLIYKNKYDIEHIQNIAYPKEDTIFLSFIIISNENIDFNQNIILKWWEDKGYNPQIKIENIHEKYKHFPNLVHRI